MVECQLPKLDVAGSNPVSRSIVSITYGYSSHPPNPPFCCKCHVFSYLQSILSTRHGSGLKVDPPMY